MPEDLCLAGLLWVAAGAWLAGAWAALDPPPHAVTRPSTPAASTKRSLLVRIWVTPEVAVFAVVSRYGPLFVKGSTESTGTGCDARLTAWREPGGLRSRYAAGPPNPAGARPVAGRAGPSNARFG